MQAISNDFHMLVARGHTSIPLEHTHRVARRRAKITGDYTQSNLLWPAVKASRDWRTANQRLSSRAVAEDRARRKKGARKL